MRRLRVVVTVLAALLVLAVPATRAARADAVSLTAQALLGNDRTDLYLTVSSAAGRSPDRLDLVEVTALPFAGDHLAVRVFTRVPVQNGVAVVQLEPLARNRPLRVHVALRDATPHVLSADARVLLRPNLTVSSLSAPADALRGRPLTVQATVAESAGDVGATATATLYDGGRKLESRSVSVAAGGRTTAAFEATLADLGRHDLRAVVSDSVPAEANTSDNEAVAPVDVHRYTSDGVVSTDHWIATKVGEDVLRAGGNAIDAAAAIQFALNVVDPNLNGLGGGISAVVRLADGEQWAVDGREVAPHETTADEFKGQTTANVRINGFSVGVPATLRAVAEMLKRWGTMPLADVLREPTALADDGVPVGMFLAGASAELRTLDLQPETIAMFRRPDGTPLQPGDLLVQHDLAKTFRLIAAQGPDVFYRGEIAQAIVDAQKRLSPTKPIAGGEGRMTLADLANLRVTFERPLSLAYRGTTVLGPPPSTNGGLVLLETLGLYQRVQQANPDADFGWGSFPAMHGALEAMRLAFADRDMWIGDDEVVDLPTAGLLSDAYLSQRAAQIRLDDTRIAVALPGDPRPFDPAGLSATDEAQAEGGHTTHFSIVDRWGNAVAMTTTVADSFGSGIMVPGYGFELNDSLSLFNPTPALDPATGNPGANDAGADKRPMGSMTPTIVLKGGEPILLTGTYGSM
ncbi:MAG TPA: gamma-glutamyltransferase, partial [Gaiellaceae bacterium]